MTSEPAKLSFVQNIMLWSVLTGVFVIIAIPITQTLIWFRFGIWPDADIASLVVLFQTQTFDAETISAWQSRHDSFLMTVFQFEWVGIRKIVETFLDIHISILMLLISGLVNAIHNRIN